MPYFNYQNKQIFYEEIGAGFPTVLLHGNTGSSKMFDVLIPMYKDRLKLILIDFLGNGNSDRFDEVPANIWQDEGSQTIALIEFLGYPKVNLIGTSGGAWAAINAGLARPDLIDKIVADSFDGRTLHAGFFDELVLERSHAKNYPMARQFYEFCQGDDWESVVDFDTEALLRLKTFEKALFWQPLSTLKNPILFLGSRKDSMLRKNLEEEYVEMVQSVKNGKMHLFDEGGHPAIFTNAIEATQIIIDFLCDVG
jgi:pimeloyl-ACP methyl ester carboxylesterase